MATMNESIASEPVTVVIAQRVKPGQELPFETWMREIIAVASTYPGHLGTNVIHPQPGIRPEYVIIFRFDGYENLKLWMSSRDREHWLAQAKPFITTDPEIQQISGLEAWFSLPGQPLKTPPRYKTALLTWAVVFVLINLLNWLVLPVLTSFPAWVRTLIFSGIMVILLTYVVMPRVTRLLRKWLYKD
ncbi:MAG: antibiotic biosynthesis monooxygenase [Leptolyngbyaceae cyanobacterium bins.302]|nr:antibiotic biosynthesis monooxygenase [Leptolyngbyaceae cyanobacterium bins.302]